MQASHKLSSKTQWEILNGTVVNIGHTLHYRLQKNSSARDYKAVHCFSHGNFSPEPQELVAKAIPACRAKVMPGIWMIFVRHLTIEVPAVCNALP